MVIVVGNVQDNHWCGQLRKDYMTTRKSHTCHGQLENPRLSCHGLSYDAHASHTPSEIHLWHGDTTVRPSWDTIRDHSWLLVNLSCWENVEGALSYWLANVKKFEGQHQQHLFSTCQQLLILGWEKAQRPYHLIQEHWEQQTSRFRPIR